MTLRRLLDLVLLLATTTSACKKNDGGAGDGGKGGNSPPPEVEGGGDSGSHYGGGTEGSDIGGDGVGSGDDGNDGSSGEQGFFATNNFNTRKLSDRSKAQATAANLALSSGLDVYAPTALGGRYFGMTETPYDAMETYVHTYDPSLSMLKSVRTNLCILNELKYTSLPENETTVTADISKCMPKADKANPFEGQLGGEFGRSEKEQDEADQLAKITYESFVNTDLQLIVIIKYRETAIEEWETDSYKRVTFVIYEPVSTDAPLGGFMTLTESSPSGFDAAPSLEQTEMVIGAVETADGKRTKIRYRGFIEDTHSRMVGYFKGEDGSIISGRFVAEVEGWDPQTGEPGGAYRVAFDRENMLREKKISDPDAIFGPDSGVEIEQETSKECYRKEFETTAFNYRLFKPDGQNIDFRMEMELSNANGSIGGWVDYNGASFYRTDDDSWEEIEVEKGTTFYEVDWENYNTETGKPGLKNEPYTVEITNGKFTKYSMVLISNDKLDGKSLDWIGEWDEQSGESNYWRLKYDAGERKFFKTAKWSDSEEQPETSKWHPLDTPVEYAMTQGDTFFAWSGSMGGLMQISFDGTDYEVRIEKSEIVRDPSQLPAKLICAHNCPKTTITADSLIAYNESDSEAAHAAIYLDNPEHVLDEINGAYVYTREEGSLTLKLNDVAIELVGTVEPGNWIGSVSVRMYGKTEWEDAAALNTDATSAWDLEPYIDTWYEYELGFDLWSKTVTLKDGEDNPVEFDAPISFDYTLKEADLIAGGRGADRVGELFHMNIEWGYLDVPWQPAGIKKDPITGHEWEHWLPAFALKDGVVLNTGDSGTFKIKAEFAERQMKEADMADCENLYLPEADELKLPERKIYLSDGDASGSGNQDECFENQVTPGTILHGPADPCN